MQSYNHSIPRRPSHRHAASIDIPPSQLPPRPHFTKESTISVTRPPIPPSLTPGRARIWDKGSAAPMPLPSSYLSPQRSSLYGDYFFLQPQTPPPLPQKPQALLEPLSSSLPPVPPKPPALATPPASRIPLYPTSIPLPLSSLGPETPDESDILTLSESVTRKREQELIALEEEELTRALEESRLYSVDEQPLGTSSADRASISATKAFSRPPEGESWLHLVTPSTSSSLTNDFTHHNESDGDPASDSSGATQTDGVHIPQSAPPPSPPLYATVVSSLVQNQLPLSAAASSSSNPHQSDRASSADRAPSSPSSSAIHSSSGDNTSSSSSASRPILSAVPSEHNTPTRRSVGSEFTSSGHKSPAQSPASPDLSLASSVNMDSLDDEARGRADTETGLSASTRPAIPHSANQYVEREMLMGVSMGFHPPVISTELTPMAGAMPNVITLPYGKAPLFHFQAPSWRKLLKLMARLSGTRVEPTVEALSVSKHELRLRTVIQFVKIHHSASEWRTVLYLTTDYPVPPTIPNGHRYTNGDVSVLPYSYALSPLAPLLRDGPESPLSKYYVVPSTPTTPYPNLPIDFPNLAMYLQSAVRDSRRAASDSSGGLRKLAQYVDSCYQTETEQVRVNAEAASKKGGVAFMFKRVIRRNKASKSMGGNEEIYDLVTPFVSDEWG